MSRTFLNEDNVHLLLHRARALSPAATGAWGNMTVGEMLFHCNTINSAILSGKPSQKKPTVKQRLLKIIVLRLTSKLPKGVKTNPKYLKQDTDTINFEKEKSNFIETLSRFASHKEAIFGNHPFFGSLNTNEWRRFVWMHTDHHLRQFGV